jgi:hypothetical protein
MVFRAEQLSRNWIQIGIFPTGFVQQFAFANYISQRDSNLQAPGKMQKLERLHLRKIRDQG